jgi:hypothetical protein
MKPNIFEISTKELTQDGFITWLLRWADPGNKKYDAKLNDCAIKFVQYLIKKQCKEYIEINSIEAGSQWEHIDIWADVNEKYFIIIVYKTFTGEHSNQLETYKDTAQAWCKENNRKLVCIYLKTGTEARTSLKAIPDKGFSVIERSELINFFGEYNIKNDIYADFVAKINNLELNEKAYEKKLIKDWDYGCWTGFYHFLDSQLENMDWGYVANPAGGFLGFWWYFSAWDNYEVYLQIEQGNLCFKIGEVKENRTEVRDRWHEILLKKAEQENRTEIVRPGRFGSGGSMTAAIVERKHWLGNDNEIIEKDKIIARLRGYENFLEHCLE